MRETQCVLALGACALLAAAPAVPVMAAPPATLDQIIARHIEARGGVGRWGAIRSLEITGSMTSWSTRSPFTLLLARDRKYHLDSTQNGKKVEVGFDGTTAWSDNHWVQVGARKMAGADLAALLREVDFPTPFFDYREKGLDVRLLGTKDFDGREAIGLEVKRQDGMTETWYLDPGTLLEIGLDSPGSDYGRPVPRRTWFDDFRDVEGVMIPFRVESQWYTRERVFEVEKVRPNVAIDDAVFGFPPPTGMGSFLALAGEWKVAASRRPQPGAPWEDSERTARIESLLGGALVQERFSPADGSEIIRALAYDRLRKRYRLSEVDDATGLMDIQEGDFDEQKRLVLSNLSTGTTAATFGFTVHSRTTISEITANGFRFEREYSIDGGKEWFLGFKAAYTRRAPQAAENPR